MSKNSSNIKNHLTNCFNFQSAYVPTKNWNRSPEIDKILWIMCLKLKLVSKVKTVIMKLFFCFHGWRFKKFLKYTLAWWRRSFDIDNDTLAWVIKKHGWLLSVTWRFKAEAAVQCCKLIGSKQVSSTLTPCTYPRYFLPPFFPHALHRCGSLSFL